VELNPGPPRLPTKQRWQIVFLAETEKNPRTKKPYFSKIARKVKCSVNTVKDILLKYEQTGDVEDLPRCGRKRKLSDREAKAMVKKAKKGKFAPEIAHESKKKIGVRTVQNTLKKAGIKYLKIKKVEKLSQAHMERRVKYSRDMKGYKWNKVLFSDEKTFYLGASPEYDWQDPENRLEAPKVNYPKKLNVWGAIGLI
jgi:transposase